MEQCSCGHGDSRAVLDVREMAPRVRHPKIFDTFDRLAPGEAFILVNDHDPKPLFYQFQAERAGAFRWQYLEEGPETWRVEIARPTAAIRPGRTVGDVVRDIPGAREVMEKMGVNHCCGAGLTLREAAAAAGVPLEDLLDALTQPERARS